MIDRPALNWIGPLTSARFKQVALALTHRLTVSEAPLRRRLGRAPGEVEEAVHEGAEVGPGGVLRPGVRSGEIWETADPSDALG